MNEKTEQLIHFYSSFYQSRPMLLVQAVKDKNHRDNLDKGSYRSIEYRDPEFSTKINQDGYILYRKGLLSWGSGIGGWHTFSISDNYNQYTFEHIKQFTNKRNSFTGEFYGDRIISSATCIDNTITISEETIKPPYQNISYIDKITIVDGKIDSAVREEIYTKSSWRKTTRSSDPLSVPLQERLLDGVSKLIHESFPQVEVAMKENEASLKHATVRRFFETIKTELPPTSFAPVGVVTSLTPDNVDVILNFGL